MRILPPARGVKARGPLVGRCRETSPVRTRRCRRPADKASPSAPQRNAARRRRKYAKGLRGSSSGSAARLLIASEWRPTPRDSASSRASLTCPPTLFPYRSANAANATPSAERKCRVGERQARARGNEQPEQRQSQPHLLRAVIKRNQQRRAIEQPIAGQQPRRSRLAAGVQQADGHVIGIHRVM